MEDQCQTDVFTETIGGGFCSDINRYRRPWLNKPFVGLEDLQINSNGIEGYYTIFLPKRSNDIDDPLFMRHIGAV